MRRYISLSRFPGKQGFYYFTEFFHLYKMVSIYNPIGTDDLKGELDNAIENRVHGISVSMPFKQDVIKYLDYADILVTEHNTCNTILNIDGKLHGYNCDHAGAAHVLSNITEDDTVTVLGAGSMGSMIYNMLDPGNRSQLVSPSLNNWDLRYQPASVVINCTNRGTATPASPLEHLPEGCRLVIDLTVSDCELAKQVKSAGVKYISGQEFYKHQFIKQFKVYTGVNVRDEDYEKFRQTRP